MPELGSRLGRDGAGQAQLVFPQHLGQLGALDRHQFGPGGQLRIEQARDLGAQVVGGIVLGLEIEDGHGENLWFDRTTSGGEPEQGGGK